MKKIILFIAFLLCSIVMLGQETKRVDRDLPGHYPMPKVDRRVELLSIVFRLAGNSEYNDDVYRSYVSDIHRHFDPYKDHPLIAFARELRDKNGVCFDAVMCMAIYLEQPPELNPVAAFSARIPERRWGQDDASKFVGLLKQFYTDAKCDDFFKAQEGRYNTAREKFMPVYKALDVNWYSEYYGTQPDDSLNIAIGLGLGGGNYGPKAVYPDSTEALYAIMGTAWFDSTGIPVYPVDNCLPTLIHEFNHSWVNPLTKKYEKEFENAGIKLFAFVKAGMENQHYNNWQTMMNESLVRASVIRYLLKHHPDGKEAKYQLISDFDKGFFWMNDLVEILEVYEKNRIKYPTLENYLPVLADFYNVVAKKSQAMVVSGQNTSLKEQAMEEFKKEHYNEAVALLEQASRQTPEDAEIYYYLGWFNHYRAYDSRPLSGYDYSYSEQIFKYLDKALELKSDYGDARYFYGAECSANAFFAMRNYDAERLRYFYKLADEKGAYPDWLKEFGRNFLNSCDKDAILFTGGNADFDVCLYLQLHEGVRTDVNLIPIGNIDRPWYVQFLKNGLKNTIKKVEINLLNQQIMDIHPYKWDTTTVSINVSSTDRKQFGLPGDYLLQWQIGPDLFSERMHSKTRSEKAQKRAYLSPQRAILLHIVESNFSQRPVYFSNFCSPTLVGGLNVYFQNCGLVSRLTPILTKDTDFSFNYGKMAGLLREQHLINFKTLINNDMPRISGIIVSGYYNALLNLYDQYGKTNDREGKIQLKVLYEKHLKIGYDTIFEDEIQNGFEK